MTAALVYDLEYYLNKQKESYILISKDYSLKYLISSSKKDQADHREKALIFYHRALLCEEVIEKLRSYKDESNS